MTTSALDVVLLLIAIAIILSAVATLLAFLACFAVSVGLCSPRAERAAVNVCGVLFALALAVAGVAAGDGALAWDAPWLGVAAIGFVLASIGTARLLVR